MAAQRIVRELEVVALADEEPERPLELARRLRRLREAARSSASAASSSSCSSSPPSAAAMCSRSTPSARSRRSMRSAPQPSSLRRSSAKRCGEAGVVDDSRRSTQLAEHLLDSSGVDALALEEPRAARPPCARAGSAPRQASVARVLDAAPPDRCEAALARRSGAHGRRPRPLPPARVARPRPPAAPTRPRRPPARPRSASRGPGRRRAPRRSWPRSPWPPRGARRGSPWRCCGPGRAARRRRRRTSRTW